MDEKKLAKLKRDIDDMIFRDYKGKTATTNVEVDKSDYMEYFRNLDEKLNNMK